MSSKSLLVIGAAATIQSALKRNIPTIAFLRNTFKLPSELSNNALLKTFKGDALSKQSIKEAITPDGQPVSAIVLAAPMGSMRERGATKYEDIARSVIESVQEVQNEQGVKIKLWVMAGSALLAHPEFPDRLLNSFMPVMFYEEYEYSWKDLQNRFRDIDWSINCPALIRNGEPRGPYYHTKEVLPGYTAPYTLTRYLPFNLGYAINIMFSNWMPQPVTFKTLAEFMVDHLELDTDLKHQRVGVLEDPNAK